MANSSDSVSLRGLHSFSHQCCLLPQTSWQFSRCWCMDIQIRSNLLVTESQHLSLVYHAPLQIFMVGLASQWLEWSHIRLEQQRVVCTIQRAKLPLPAFIWIHDCSYSYRRSLVYGTDRNGTVPSHYFTERNRLECSYDCQKCRMCVAVEMR